MFKTKPELKSVIKLTLMSQINKYLKLSDTDSTFKPNKIYVSRIFFEKIIRTTAEKILESTFGLGYDTNLMMKLVHCCFEENTRQNKNHLVKPSKES